MDGSVALLKMLIATKAISMDVGEIDLVSTEGKVTKFIITEEDEPADDVLPSCKCAEPGSVSPPPNDEGLLTIPIEDEYNEQ